MAVEGFGRVPLGQAGTGEAFILDRGSKALDTYVQQEQAQIAAKKKAEDDAINRKLPDYGWFYTDTMNKDITAYKENMYKTMQEKGDVTSPELAKQFETLQQKAIATQKYTGRLDELNKADGKQLWGDNAKYFDKSLLIKGITAKLTDENGNPKDPLQVNSKDLEDIYDPNAFLTNVFIDDFVKNIKDQFVDVNTGFVKNGYGTYIETTDKGIRFVTTDEKGNVVPGVDNNVAQLALDNPIYSQVIGKKVDEDLTNVVKKLMAEGVSEKEAKELVAIKRKDFMMEYAKEDILAYQQLSSKADMKLGINNATSKAALDQADAAKKSAQTNADKFKFDKGKWEKENKANVNADPSLTPTDYPSKSGKTNILALGNIGVPKDKIGKNGKNQPLQLTPTSVFYIDGVTKDRGSAIEGANLSVRGKEVQGQILKAQDRTGSGTATYIPIKTKAAVMDEQGNLVSYNDPDSKTNTDDMKEFRNKKGYSVNLVMEAEEVIGYDDKGVPNKFRTVLLPITNDNSGSNILQYNNFNDVEEAQNAIDQAAGTTHNWGNKSSMQGFQEKEPEEEMPIIGGGTTTQKTKTVKSKSGATIPIIGR